MTSMQLFQFAGAALGASVVISLASLLWPKVSAEPRPPVLSKVREMVVSTDIGKNAAQVLGVTDEANTVPVQIGSFVAGTANAAIDSVTRSAQHAVTARLLETLAGQFNGLPDEDKKAFRARICTPQAE